MNRLKVLAGVLAFFVALYLFFHFVFLPMGEYKPNVKPMDTTVRLTKQDLYIFQNMTGPKQLKPVVPNVPTPLSKYHKPAPGKLALLVLDTGTSWLGLVNLMTTHGIPFYVTTSVEEALKNKVIFVYPNLEGRLFKGTEPAQLAAFVRGGGALIACNVLMTGMQPLFGIKQAEPSKTRYSLLLDQRADPIMAQFDEPEERSLRLGSIQKFEEVVGTYGYATHNAQDLIHFEDNTQFLVKRKLATGGAAYAFGVDLGNMVQRCLNGRGFNAERQFINGYEPLVDVMGRIVKAIYMSHQPNAVTLWTVPFGKAMTLNLTHDIDYKVSLQHAVNYANFEKKMGVKGTYFIQTKYIRDWNDDIFYNDEGAGYTKQIHDMGMEVASHTVAHSFVFSNMILGTGQEQYPKYQPFVRKREKIVNGSIMGELRVSKFLLDSAIKTGSVKSFRPGHLSYPFSLPQALEASDYAYSSSISANAINSHLPFALTYNRAYNQLMPVYEFPVTVEDEYSPPLAQRLNQALEIARKLQRFGGYFNLLIHTDVKEEKMDFERRFIEAVKDQSYSCTLAEFGDWWATRAKVQVSNTGGSITVFSPKLIDGLTLVVPQGRKLAGAKQQGNLAVLPAFQGTKTFKLM